MKGKLVKCVSCGKLIYRKRTITVNKYGVWGPKCEECKRIEKRAASYVRRSSERTKRLYHTDAEFRKKVLERARRRYWRVRKKTLKLTPEEKQLLQELNSYPVLGPGCLGTSGPTTNYKVVEVNGVQRIKGAVWLEKWKKQKRKC